MSPQTITFNAIASQTIGTPLALSAMASSGLPVSFSSSTANVCSVSGGTASFLAAGNCTITASQAGNGSYLAATPVSQSFGVLSTQTITFNAIAAQAVGTPLSLSAMASSGLPVSFSSSTTSVCNVSGVTAYFSASGSCTITASQAGNGSYSAAAPVSQSFAVLGSQIITFNAIASQAIGTPLALNAMASSGLPVSFSSSTASVCSVSGSTASFITSGSCTITASQAGNGSYSAATPVSQSFTVHSGSNALQFVPVTPCRVADTRLSNGPFGGPEMTAGSTRNFFVPNSSCGIPSTALAYSLNVTVVPDARLSYLTIWPAGQTQPVVSTLNSDGRIKANAAIVPAGSSGGVAVYVTDSTQVVLDIDGYFVSGNSSALDFYPVTPCRVADTRLDNGLLGRPYLSAGVARSFPILTSSCNIPSSAQAYSLNFTAVPHSQLSYLTTWPTGQAQPVVSTLNSRGPVTANAAIVPAGTEGAVDVYATDDSEVVIDINGYFAPQGAGGLSLYNVTPCRTLDTRLSSGQFEGTIATNVTASACGVSASAQAYVLNATVVPAGALSYLTLWPTGEPQPVVSTLNSDGSITSNMGIVPTLNGSVNSYATDPTHLILDISAYFAP